MDDLAPIILFAYNRPLHTKSTLDALANNAEAKDSILYIYCDGPKAGATRDDIDKVNKTRLVVKREDRFKEVIVKEQIENKGLANSIIDGVTEVIDRHKKAIIVEDDIVTSPYFLRFMNDGLNTYKSNPDVICISGYIFPVKGKLPETFFIKVAECWGWATWKRGWDDFEKDGKKLLKELTNSKLEKEFDFEGSYAYMDMLKDQINGKNNSWAIRWYASAFLKNKYCLFPGVSMVQNIGIDGSGTHSGTSDKLNVDLSRVKINVNRIEVKENAEAKKLIINYFHALKKSNYSVSKRAKGRIKSIIRKLNLRK